MKPDYNGQGADALKIPPHSLQAEQSVLGGLMLDNQTWHSIVDIINESDFYRKDHRLIFRTIEGLAEKQIPFDVITISDELEAVGELQEIGGLAYLGLLANDTPSAANIVSYANIVRDRSLRRKLIHVSTTIANAAFNNEGRSASELIRQSERELLEIESSVSRSGLGFSNADEMAAGAKAPNYLINQCLESDSHGILAGSSQAFKSFMALAMAHSICTGADFFNHKVHGAHKVVYICGEGKGALARRMRAVSVVHGGFNNNLMVLDQKIRIDNEDDIKAVSIKIKDIGPALVIFDTFSSMNSATNENDNSDVAAALGMIQRNLSNGFTSSLIVHHFGKDEERGIRGASAFTANSDFILVMKREDPESMEVSLKSIKTKDGDNFAPINAVARIVDLGIEAQDGDKTTSLILANAEQRFSGRPTSTHDKLDNLFDHLVETRPDMTSDGESGVAKKALLEAAKQLLLIKSESCRVMTSSYINSMKKKGLMIENQGILIKT